MSRFSDTRDALWSAIRAADPLVKDRNIHRRIRNPKNTTPSDAEALMGYDDGEGSTYLRGYFISRIAIPGTSEEAVDGDDAVYNKLDTYRIRAIWSFSDESETREQDLNEVIDAIISQLETGNDAIAGLEGDWNSKIDSVSCDAIILDLLAARDLIYNVLITVNFRIDAITE